MLIYSAAYTIDALLYLSIADTLMGIAGSLKPVIRNSPADSTGNRGGALTKALDSLKELAAEMMQCDTPGRTHYIHIHQDSLYLLLPPLYCAVMLHYRSEICWSGADAGSGAGQRLAAGSLAGGTTAAQGRQRACMCAACESARILLCTHPARAEIPHFSTR